jgi:hypothetical protein
MRVALYILAAQTVLPYALPSAGFLLPGQAISGGTLFAFIRVLLIAAVWLVPSGMLAIAFTCIVLLLGVSERWRWLGASCQRLVALASLVVIVYPAIPEFDPPQLLFVLPCALVMLPGGRLALSGFRRRRQTTA